MDNAVFESRCGDVYHCNSCCTSFSSIKGINKSDIPKTLQANCKTPNNSSVTEKNSFLYSTKNGVSTFSLITVLYSTKFSDITCIKPIHRTKILFQS